MGQERKDEVVKMLVEKVLDVKPQVHRNETIKANYVSKD